MTSALDDLQSDPLFAILPPGREVTINKGKALVVGVSWNFIGRTLGRFPQLADYLRDAIIGSASAEDQSDEQKLRAAADNMSFGIWLVSNVSAAVPSLLAAGIGRADDPKAEAIMGRLGALEQIDLINEILKETIGGDRDFFFEKLRSVAVTVGYGRGGAEDKPVAAGRMRRVTAA